MGNRKAWFIDFLVGIDQEVKIEDTRPPARVVALTALAGLNVLQRSQELQWRKASQHSSDRVDEIRLLDTAKRRGTVLRRYGDKSCPGNVREQICRILDLFYGPLEIAAEAYVGRTLTARAAHWFCAGFLRRLRRVRRFFLSGDWPIWKLCARASADCNCTSVQNFAVSWLPRPTSASNSMKS